MMICREVLKLFSQNLSFVHNFLDAQFLFDFCYFINTAFIDYRDDTNNFGRFDWQDFVLNCFTDMFVFRVSQPLFCSFVAIYDMIYNNNFS